jgi:DNA polymerase III gamma/tau subunit
MDFLLNIAKNINKKENFNLDELELINLIKISNYSISNLINYFQKLLLLGNNKNVLENLNSNIILSDFHEYFELCKKSNYKEACKIITKIINNGFSIIDILENIIIYLKTYNIDLKQDVIFKIIEIILKYINIFYNIHEDDIEIYFLTNNIISILNDNN